MRNIIPVVGEIIEALRDQFGDPDNPPVGGLVTDIEHRPGAEVALDGLWVEGCPGLVWVNVIRMFRSKDFPNESEEAVCSGQPAVIVEVGAARKVSTVDDLGYPPTSADMEQDSLTGLDDAQRIERAVCRAAKRCNDRGLTLQATWGASEPHGPMGGALAWTKPMTLQLAR